MAIANSDGSIVLTTKIVIDNIKKTINQLKSNFNSLGEQKRAINDLSNSIKYSKNLIKEYTLEYGKLVNRGEQYTEQGKKIQAAISREQGKISQLKRTITLLGGDSKKTFASMSAGLKNFGKRIAGIIKSVLIFSLLYKVMQSVVKLFKNILVSDEQFRQDWEELKAAFYTAAYPIINLIVPAIKYIVQQVRDWAVSIGKVAAALQGMTYSELVDQAKASKEAADNYSDMEKSSKKTADNVKKQLASFDDIQILSSGNESENGANGAGFEGLGQYDTSGEKSMLDDLMTAIGGALVAVGIILLFHGQLAWGIGFIIAGAVSGTFGVAMATLSDESVSQKAKDELSNAMLIVGVVAIVLGILLCMAQQWELGIGLIAVGVASIVTPIALNWNGIKEKLQGSFGAWLAIGGIVAIVLGILLCFTPALPLGIGLIVLGVGAVVAPIVANWDAIWNTITTTFAKIINWIETHGLAMLVLGCILCATGVALPIGLALIAFGVKGMVQAKDPTTNAIVDWVKGAWEAVKAFWNKYIAPVFTAKFWLDLAKKCGNGLINGFESAINGIIGMFEKMINWIVNGLNKISFDIPDWLGGGSFGINIPNVSFGRVSIPRLAQGAVIPPNREFLAVLGDNKKENEIVSPVSTMKQAFMEAMIEMGGNFGGGNTEVVLEIDGREFGRAVVEQGNRENRRIGTRLVMR